VAAVEIRDATPDDWPEIWPIFSEVVRAGETYAFDPAMTSDEARTLWLEQPPGHTVVALVDGAVVGTAKMGPNRPARGSHVGTASFMVGPAARGHGVGRALATYVVDWHRDHGYRGIQFNAVVETNTRPWRCGGRSGSRSSAPCRAPSTTRRTGTSACT
jgi:L-amino acid N-acyltransferase YncA